MRFLLRLTKYICLEVTIVLFVILLTSCGKKNDVVLVEHTLDMTFSKVTPLSVTPTPLRARVTSQVFSSFVATTTKLNRIQLGPVDTIVDTTVVVKQPGRYGMQYPDTILVSFNSNFVTQPAIVIAKDAYVKDENSLCISSFSKLQGLIDNVVNVIYSDRKGNMWLGTDGGVVKFDGKWFTSYSTRQGLPTNEIISITEDRKGNLWFGHYDGGGVSMFNGEQIVRFKGVWPLKNDCVWTVFEDSRGNMWFGTSNNGAYKYDGEKLVHYGLKQGFSNNASAIVEDKNRCLWFATGEGVCRFDGESFTHQFSKTVLCDNKYTNSLYIDNSDNVWFSSSNGVFKYDGSTLLHYSIKSGLSDKFVTTIYQDRKGVFWFGTDIGGVNRFDGKYFSHITMKEGLTNNTVFSINEDGGGNMWFGTWTGGLCKYSGDIFTHYTTNEGLPENNVISLVEQDESIWIGTWDNGLCKYKDGQFYVKDRLKYKEVENPIYSMIVDQSKNIWLGCDKGVYRIKDGKGEWMFNAYSEVLTGVKAIYEDRAGDVWFSSNNKGLVKWVRSENRFYSYTKEHGLPTNNVCSFFEDNSGLLWIGTADKGFGYFNGASLFWLSDKIFENIPMIDAITEDKLGNIWFGSRGEGVFVFCSRSIAKLLENSSFVQKTYKIDGRVLLKFTSKQGLSGDLVNAMITTKEGEICIGTESGLSRVINKNLSTDEAFIRAVTSVDGLLFKNYSYNDGFLGIGVNHGNNGRNIIERKEGDYWIAANNMVTRFSPKSRVDKISVPIMQIVNIEISGEQIDWFKISSLKEIDNSNRLKYVSYDTTIMLTNGVLVKNCTFDSLMLWNNLPSNLSLNYKNNYITFNYVGSSISDSYRLKYQYVLEGFDTEWSLPTNKTSVAYANLLPKRYTFKVKGMNSQGVWSEPLSYSFTIRSPWWQTSWFYALVSVVILLLLYLVYRIRTASLRENQQRLKMEIDIATLEISNSNEILMQQYDDLCEKSAIVSEQKEELEVQRDAMSKQKSELERVYAELNESIDYAMQIQYSVLPEFTEVKEHCEDYFIFYRPRDFVSGDFYWSDFVERRLILAVADCTGHGVPGGFMSMLGMTYLQQIVSKEYITQPDVILKKLRREIITNLRQKGTIGEHKDGMDISLCSINIDTLEMQWAGAYNPCIIIRDGELTELKGDKMPIAIYDKMGKFTLHHYQLQKGDNIYLYSDGYGDQFGGPNEKRFNSKNVKKLLLEISNKSMNEQRQELEGHLSSWMYGEGKLNDQLDDITIVGVRI